jgi:hypothetical protein
LLSKDELYALAKNIEHQGLREAVVIWKSESGEESLLDGRNRLDALELDGTTIFNSEGLSSRPDFLKIKTVFETDGVDPYEYVISANIHRRHLTPELRRDVIAKLLKANPRKSDRQIAKMVDASPTTVGDERKKTCPRLDTSIDTKGRRQPRKKPKPKRPAAKPTSPIGLGDAQPVIDVPGEPEKPEYPPGYSPPDLTATIAMGQEKAATEPEFKVCCAITMITRVLDMAKPEDRRSIIAELRKELDRQETLISASERKADAAHDNGAAL